MVTITGTGGKQTHINTLGRGVQARWCSETNSERIDQARNVLLTEGPPRHTVIIGLSTLSLTSHNRFKHVRATCCVKLIERVLQIRRACPIPSEKIRGDGKFYRR